jgi:hypothetical protein
MEPLMHHGSCLCGAIRYSIDDNLKFIVNCHCRFCSKAHGAPFTTLLIMPFVKLELIEGKELLAAYEVTALNTTRRFCSKCGTRLYNYSPAKGMISLVVATLDAGAEIRPLAHINTGSKCTWHQIDDGLPQFSSVPSKSEFGQLLSS